MPRGRTSRSSESDENITKSYRPPAYGLNAGRIRDHKMNRPDRHQDVEINYFERGTAAYRISADYVELGAGDLLIFWSILPHQLIDAENVHGVYIHVPTASFLQWELPQHLLRSVLAGEPLVIHSQQLGGLDRELFNLWVNDLTVKDKRDPDQIRQQVMWEIEGRLRRIAPHNTRHGLGHAGHVPVVVSEMARMIVDHCSDPDLSAKAVSRSVGLHEKYAMTLFRRHLGITVYQFLLRHRLARAQCLLATTDDTVLAVAMNCGFNSMSRFYEQFKQETGLTPKGYRRQVTRGGSGQGRSQRSLMGDEIRPKHIR